MRFSPEFHRKSKTLSPTVHSVRGRNCCKRCKENLYIIKKKPLFSRKSGFQISRSYSCFIALILTPGPMVEAATQERMY